MSQVLELKLRFSFAFVKVVAGLDGDLDPRQPSDLSTPASYTSQVLNLLQVHCVTYTLCPFVSCRTSELLKNHYIRRERFC